MDKLKWVTKSVENVENGRILRGTLLPGTYIFHPCNITAIQTRRGWGWGPSERQGGLKQLCITYIYIYDSTTTNNDNTHTTTTTNNTNNDNHNDNDNHDNNTNIYIYIYIHIHDCYIYIYIHTYK